MLSQIDYESISPFIRCAFAQRRLNFLDVGPTLYKCYTNVFCLLGRG